MTAMTIAVSTEVSCSRINKIKVESNNVTAVIVCDIMNKEITAQRGNKNLSTQKARSFKKVVANSFELPYHEMHFMTGKYLQRRGDRMVLEAYIWSNTLTDQYYNNAGKSIKAKKLIIQVNTTCIKTKLFNQARLLIPISE